MILQIFACGPIETNTYILGCSRTKKAWIIDAPKDSYQLLCHAIEEGGLHIEKIVLTHSHWDHIADLCHLKNKFCAPVIVHEADAGNIESPGSDGLPLYFPIEKVQSDELLHGGETLSSGDETIQVLHTPGHSPGGICLYNKAKGILIAGDTLFRGSMGRIDLPTSSPEAMWESLKVLSGLPPLTKVYPGHGPSTSIGEESWMGQAKYLFS